MVFISLALSGLLLYIPTLRSVTADFRWLLALGHSLFGLLVPILLAANIPFFLTPAVLKKTENSQGNAVLLLGAAIVQMVSGLLLFLGKEGVLTAPLIVAQIHAVTALVFLPLLLSHVYRTRNADRTVDFSTFSPGAIASTRRKFLFNLGALLALLGSWSGMEWLRDRLASSQKSETLSHFEDCNKMNPPAVPAGGAGSVSGGYTGQFRVYTVATIPCSNSNTWSFSVTGLVNRPAQYRWSEFLELPRTTQVSDFHCVEGWSVKQITYEGITLSRLLEIAGVRPEARFIKFISGDGVYSDALSLKQAMMPDALVGILVDGRPIPSALGGPARLVIPQMFAYKAVKWLIGIELVNQPHSGYWEQRGYPVDAWAGPQRTL